VLAVSAVAYLALAWYAGFLISGPVRFDQRRWDNDPAVRPFMLASVDQVGRTARELTASLGTPDKVNGRRFVWIERPDSWLLDGSQVLVAYVAASDPDPYGYVDSGASWGLIDRKKWLYYEDVASVVFAVASIVMLAGLSLLRRARLTSASSRRRKM
jgi:hypothetical protein